MLRKKAMSGSNDFAKLGEQAGVPADVLHASRSRPDHPSRLLIRTGDRAFFLPTETIQWIEADGDFVILHVAGRSHRIRGTLSGLYARLEPSQFLRVHRSAIVNVSFIAEMRLKPDASCLVVLQDGTMLKLSRSFRSILDEFGGLLEASRQD